jgi:hypothetical protein
MVNSRVLRWLQQRQGSCPLLGSLVCSYKQPVGPACARCGGRLRRLAVYHLSPPPQCCLFECSLVPALFLLSCVPSTALSPLCCPLPLQRKLYPRNWCLEPGHEECFGRLRVALRKPDGSPANPEIPTRKRSSN